MSEKVQYDKERLQCLIEKGMKYICYRKDSKKNDEKDINLDLLLEIREYIYTKGSDWYKDKFPEAYNFDINLEQSNNENKPYNDDGIKYYTVKDKLHYCIPYGLSSSEYKYFYMDEHKINSNIHMSYGYRVTKEKDCYVHIYKNEIDHFFTHAINSFILMQKSKLKYCYFWKERGMHAIEKKINEFEKAL